MSTIEELRLQNADLKEKAKQFVAKIKDDYAKEIDILKQQHQVGFL